MINDFLLNLSKYAKESNYPFQKINISFNIMPKAFYNCVINYLKKAYPAYKDNPKIQSFNIFFENNNAYIEILGIDNRTRCLIISDNLSYSSLPPAIVIKAEKADKDIKVLDEMTIYNIVKGLPPEFVERYIKTNNNVINIDQLMKKSLSRIFEYAKYLQMEKEFHIDKISFDDPKTDSNPINTSGITREKKPRQYNEIPIEERRKILGQYEHEFEFNAESRNKKTQYYIKVFKKPNKKYRIIMEPIESNKYIRILYVDANKLSKQQIITLVTDTLQSSFRDLSRRSDTTLHKHTTIKAYKNLIEYVANDTDIGISHSTKTMIYQAKR